MVNIPTQPGLTSWWRTEPHHLDDHISSESVPKEADVVIIGSGISGASVAYNLLQQNKGPSRPKITILEARQACSGATGRNGGHLKPDPYSSIGHLAAEYGPEAAAEVAEFEQAHVDAIRKLVETEKIDCDLVITKAIDVQLMSRESNKAKAAFDHLSTLGVKSVRRVSFSDEREAQERSRVKGAKGCFSYQAGHVWPYKLTLHILSRCLDQGAMLYTNTPAQSISPEKDNAGLWTIDTPRGPVKAKQVVFACNAYTSAILPMYSNKIIPVRGVCCRIIPANPVKRLTETYTLRWNNDEADYLIPREDGSIIVGGGWGQYGRDPGRWYNNANDHEMIESAKEYFDDYMQRNFHGWEESGAYVENIWTGIMGYSSDSLPHVGHVPGKPGQFISAGFTGHGMPQAWLSGKGVASMISNRLSFAETGIPQIFETTQARLDQDRNDMLDMMPPSSPRL
ncbi:uncharacterized protein N7511_004564 [Penicillium nucicola]|uniref:uncharacterized protein n=1 Tax=Penicillium nucicola TaxID=1850975 RepID=UPI00254507BA|nr:uncharacterized protein N7511_004564 [Penicillium nucicola]KAJ5766948.1 hypothetical protein N7511_004564 [Penicillium nucicola]